MENKFALFFCKIIDMSRRISLYLEEINKGII